MLLEPQAVELEPLKVTVPRTSRRLREVGFYERRRTGEGFFTTAREIQEKHFGSTDDVIELSPGSRIRLHTREEHQYFVDGLPISWYGEDFGIEDISLRRVAGIEVLRCVETPYEYRKWMDDWTDCTVVLIWRKE